jgi:hypothetical protein
MKWLNAKVMTVIFVVLFIVAGVLVAVGVLTHSEPGRMMVCWENNRVNYIEGAAPEEQHGTCDEPQELVWPQGQLPLSVSAPTATGEEAEEVRDQIESAVDLINSQLGFAFLAAVPGEATPDIVVTWNAAYESGEGTTAADRAPGSCSFQRLDGNMRADVRVRALGNNRLSHRVLVHELGHCGLGLDHDDFESSIMYRTTRDDTWDDRMSFTRFTDYDVEITRELYER